MKRFNIGSTLTLLALLGALTGCNQSPAGTYFSQSNPTNYLELKEDGTFFMQAKIGVHGRYRVDGKRLTIESKSGFAAAGTIQGNTLVDGNGEKWAKK